VQLTVERTVRDENGDPVHDENGQPIRETEQVEIVLGSAEQLIDPLTGQPQKGGALMDRRKREAHQAIKKYGPRARRIQIRGATPTQVPTGAVGGPVQ
ncbi:MAG: hypothetical protein ACYSXF_10985, partial [Planctomycetota bacterium]|jgi:hypothetical protein